jgi:NTE family protein
VDVESGQLRYFDSRQQPIGALHIMASGALPPAFPPVQIDGRWYWDGGIYSNTPIEAVLDDEPRRSALVFAVQLWNGAGPLPRSVTEAMHRQKDIQYASRATSHLQRQRQLHGLRHVIGALAREIPAERRQNPRVRDLLAAGCTTTMHVVRLVAPRLTGEDQFKDLDFTPAGVEARREAGLRDARRVLAAEPWKAPVDPVAGVVEHPIEATL